MSATLEGRGLFAVVVNWNGGLENQSCLTSLLDSGLPQEQIVFVDNGSADGSREEVQEAFPGLRFVLNEANLGFGEGANQGARLALEQGAESVIFINNDVTLPQGTLEPLLAALEADRGLGIVAPRVLYSEPADRIWCAGGRLDYRQNLSTLLGHQQPDEARWQRTFEVDYVAGCAMLVRREVFERIGFLEADYFAYMEDVEFCLRARKAGYRVSTIGELACYHAPSSSTGGGYSPRRKYMQGVNSIHFLRRWGDLRAWLSFAVYDVATLPLLLLAAPFRGRTRGVLAKAWGMSHGLLGRKVQAARLEPGRSWLW